MYMDNSSMEKIYTVNNFDVVRYNYRIGGYYRLYDKRTSKEVARSNTIQGINKLAREAMAIEVDLILKGN